MRNKKPDWQEAPKTDNTFICVVQMVLWQHPSNGTAAAFHDSLPDSDKLVDLMEDTTQTA